MRRILITCFGNAAAYAFANDFATRSDITLFAVDMHPEQRLALATAAYAVVPPGNDPQFAEALLAIAVRNRIDLIIPGGDEDAFALMAARAQFRAAGIALAVQDDALIPALASKSGLYRTLADRGFPVPPYRVVRTAAEFDAACATLGAPARPLLLKPDAARGGRGVCVVAETPAACAEPIPIFNLVMAVQIFDGETPYMCMPYYTGTIYDVDVLTYANGATFFGARARFSNVTKLFSGNTFSTDPALLAFARRCADVLPTRYLVDYDILVTDAGVHVLLEVNPRPSGSVVSYLPFGTNLYAVLAKSYLDGVHLPIVTPPDGAAALAFYAMVERSSTAVRAHC